MIKQSKSLQLRRRYILFREGSKENIVNAIKEGIGAVGYSKAVPVFVNSSKGIVLAVTRESLNDIRASFEISNIKIKISKVSGTLKGLE